MIYISLGSNLGHRLDYLRQAVELLKKYCLRNIKCSIILETEAVLQNNAPQEWNKPFLNMVVKGQTDLSPQDFLQKLKIIEIEIGRPENYEKWSPRVIDLDILLWEGITLSTNTLTIPHPELQNRPFFLHLLALLGVKPFNKETFLNCFSSSFVLYPRLVGVVNITTDSFSDGGQFIEPDKAVEHIFNLAKAGASIIEIGAQSTRPTATIYSPEEECANLFPVLNLIEPLLQKKDIKLSIDTFQPFVIRNVLKKYSISWINDVQGKLDDATLKLISDQGCQLCLMHSLSIPPTKQETLPLTQNPVDLILKWAEENIERLVSLGFKEQNIIIDPGIGFGKSPAQNIEILRSLENLRRLRTPILIGHSRKSYIEAFSSAKAAQRDLETLAISSLIKDKVDFLRVHNVEAHMRFLTAQEAINGK